MASPCKSQISQSSGSCCYSVVEENDQNDLRRGPWTVDEDSLLIHSISIHGEGRWNLLAIRSGLRRTGKSCRLRWLNYLKPDVKRGNLSPQEQLLIIDLHSRWGNKWSKIVRYLPGRTDNEIKNYWRTQVQKQAKILNLDANSAEFKDIINRIWIPRLVHKMNEYSPPAATRPTTQLSDVGSPPAAGSHFDTEQIGTGGLESVEEVSQVSDQFSDVPSWNHGGGGGEVAAAAADFGYPINDSGLPLADWIYDDDSFGGGLWNNFDGLWQF